jgi:hypothetical protein
VLALTGYAPSQNQGITPAAGALTLSSQAPAFSWGVATGIGTLNVTGYAPSVGVSVAPSTGVLAVAGYAPSLDRGILTAPGQIVVTGHTPAIGGSFVVNPLTGALILLGFGPTVVAQGQPVPGTGTLELTGYAPTVEATGGEDVATDPKLIARRPNVHVDFGTRKKTPAPTPAPAQITNMPKGGCATGADPFRTAVVFLELLAHGVPKFLHQLFYVIVIAAERHFAAIPGLFEPLAKLPRLEKRHVALCDGGNIHAVEIVEEDALKDVCVFAAFDANQLQEQKYIVDARQLNFFRGVVEIENFFRAD